MADGRDRSRTWDAIVQDLRRAPGADDAAIDRVMAIVRATPMDPPADVASPPRRRRREERHEAGAARSPLARAARWLVRPAFTIAPVHLLAATLVLGVGLALYRPPFRTRRPVPPLAQATSPAMAAPGATATAATAVSARPHADGTHEVRFVLVADSATRVAVAGDFNDWNPGATPMRREGSGSVWSITLRLPPGRHLYAFVVDDTTWVSDVTAPRAPESDFGGASSVLFVSRQS